MKYCFTCLFLILCGACTPEDSPEQSTDGRTEMDQLLDRIPEDLKPIFTNADTEKCAEFATINQGEITVENNTWNATNLAVGSYQQCIYQHNISGENKIGWKWSYPDSATGVNAYPELIYGKKPWHSTSTTAALPVVISSISQLKVQYAVALSRNEGEYNLAFDNWISSAASSRPEDIQFEFMIWEDYHEITPFGDFVANVSTPNGDYTLYMGDPTWEPEGTSWIYIAFVRTQTRREGTVDVDLLLNYLVDQDLVPEDSFLSTIEFGTELGNSKGYAVIKLFDVTLE